MARFDDNGYPLNLPRETAFVSDAGIGVCAECAYDAAFKQLNHWDARWRPTRVFEQLGYEPCTDEWCSVCDRDIPLV